MSLAFVLQILKVAWKTIAANWRAVVVGLAIGAAVWIFCDWRGQAAEIAALKYELKVEQQLTRQWRDVARLQSEKALEAAQMRDEFRRRLDEEIGKPPREIVKWKTITQTVPGVVADAPDCEAGVRELGKLLKGGGS